MERSMECSVEHSMECRTDRSIGFHRTSDRMFDRMLDRMATNIQACCGGPMAVVSVPESHLLNVSGFESWLVGGGIVGAEDFERAEQWVNLFRYLRQTRTRLYFWQLFGACASGTTAKRRS